MYHKIETHLFAVIAVFAFCASAGAYDVVAYVWLAYHPEPRWAELGIFADGKGERHEHLHPEGILRCAAARTLRGGGD